MHTHTRYVKAMHSTNRVALAPKPSLELSEVDSKTSEKVSHP